MDEVTEATKTPFNRAIDDLVNPVIDALSAQDNGFMIVVAVKDPTTPNDPVIYSRYVFDKVEGIDLPTMGELLFQVNNALREEFEKLAEPQEYSNAGE